MTKIRKPKERQRSYYILMVSLMATLLVGGFFLYTKNNKVPKTLLRASQQQQQQHDVSSQQEQQEQEEEGRLILLELANLKDTSKGTLVRIRTRPSWAPKGVDQFHKLIDAGFFNQCRFFRVVPDFVVQFGIAAEPMVQSEWRSQVITDDPVKTTNARGTLTFATSGPNTRSTQLFINTRRGGNKFLDQQGFSPIGEVLDDGMDIIDQIQDEYREKPNQGKIQNKGNAYLIQEFPNLSYIVSAK